MHPMRLPLKLFLFLDISKTIEKTLLDVPVSNVDTLARVVENDQLSRQIARSVIESSA